MAPVLLRIAELRALRAARLAMVEALVVLPPVAALTMLVDSAPITEDAAVVTACWAIFFFLAASREALLFCGGLLLETLLLGLALSLFAGRFLSGGSGGLGPLLLELGIGAGEDLKGGLAVDSLAVLLVQLVAVNEALDLFLTGSAHQALGRENAGAFDDAGDAVLIEEADQRLADTKLHDGVFGLEGGVGTEGPGGGADSFLLVRGIGAQSMLDTVGELGQHVAGDIAGALGDEVDADGLGADELDDLDDLLQQGFGHAVKEQVRLVEEEDHLGLVEIAHFGQALKELGQHPEQEGGVHRGALDELLAGEDVDVAAAVYVGGHPVADVQLRLAEEELTALLLEGEQGALDSADAGGGDVAVLHGELSPVLAHELEHGAQVLQVQEQQAVIVGYFEDNVQNAGLNLGQAQQTRQEHRAHGAHGHAHRVAHFAEDVPEAGGIGVVGKAVDAEALDPRLHVGAVPAGLAHAGQVALDIGQEDRDAHLGEGLGHDLHGDGLAGAGGARDQAVAVCHVRQQEQPLVRLRQPDFILCKHVSFPL